MKQWRLMMGCGWEAAHDGKRNMLCHGWSWHLPPDIHLNISQGSHVEGGQHWLKDVDVGCEGRISIWVRLCRL